MAEMQISRGDIIDLGKALDGLRLPEEQKALLSTIVSLGTESLARESAPSSGAVDGKDGAESFRDQFASSFKLSRTTTDDDGDVLKITRNVRR